MQRICKTSKTIETFVIFCVSTSPALLPPLLESFRGSSRLFFSHACVFKNAKPLETVALLMEPASTEASTRPPSRNHCVLQHKRPSGSKVPAFLKVFRRADRGQNETQMQAKVATARPFPEPNPRTNSRTKSPNQVPDPTSRAKSPNQSPEPNPRTKFPNRIPEPTPRTNYPSQIPEQNSRTTPRTNSAPTPTLRSKAPPLRHSAPKP